MNEYRYFELGGDEYSRLVLVVNDEKKELYYQYGGATCCVENQYGKVRYTKFATDRAKRLIRKRRNALLSGDIKLI